MNRIPQNDPEFLAFQRKAKARSRSADLKKAAIIVSTVVLLLALLVVGVLSIYSAGQKPAKAPEQEGDAENNGGTQNGGTQNGGTENGDQGGDADAGDGSTADGSEGTDGSENIDGSDPDDGSGDAGEPKKVVYIDPGHGFANSGLVPDKGSGDDTPYLELTGKYESDLNLEIALKLKEVLLSKGYEVLLLREQDVLEHLTINERVKRINSAEFDIFISIHANSFDDPDVCGARVYYSSENDNAVKCKNYAMAMAAALNATEGVSQRNVTWENHPDIGVIKAVKKPTVLVETCFLTSPTDAALAATEEWIALMANGMAQGIETYLAQIAITQ